MAGQGNSLKTISQNKKAFHDYFVVESMEAGIELCGTEVKAMRRGQCNLKDAWCSIDKGELFVNGMHISPYDHGNIFNRDPMRVRRLLLHKREIMRLFGLVKQEGYSLIPLSVYFKNSLVRYSSACARAKSCMTSARIWPRGPRSATLTEPSRNGTADGSVPLGA